MIKTAAIFPRQCAQNSVPVLAAARQALHDWRIRVVENTLQADAAIIWSVLWAGRMKANKSVYEHYRSQGRPIIVFDVGCLQRGVTWKIALDNINGQGWFGDPVDLDPDRPAKLGLGRSPPQPSSSVLIAVQHRASLQAQAIHDMERWVLDRIKDLRHHCDRPIVVRPHPRDGLCLDRLPSGVSLQQPRRVAGTYDSYDWQDAWWAVVNHNSGPGVLAGVAGVRPVVHPSSLAWPVSVNIKDIELPYERDRSQWLIDIAHTEYTLEEIQQGSWLKRLGSRL